MSERPWELRLGRWQEALADVEMVDAIITDPPYSERTVKGQRSNRVPPGGRKRGTNPSTSGPASWVGDTGASCIEYQPLTRADVEDLVRAWAPRVRRWWVMFGDHITVGWALAELAAAGWYTFPPTAWVKTNAVPRILSDGPSPTVEQIAIARPRRRLERAEKRYRRGHYIGPQAAPSERVPGVVGAKPLWLLGALVRDYSEPGDLIVDPFVGGGSTLLSAHTENRRAIGAEIDSATYERARARLDLAVEAA